MKRMKQQRVAEILGVGTELLLGQIANTDAQYLSQRMSELGIAVYHHQVVGDNPERMKEALALAWSRADIILTTGGIGPTQDDLTKEMVAEFLGVPMEENAESLADIEAFFERRGWTGGLTGNNRKQASAPRGARIMPNACGTAPGCIAEKDGKCIIVLPGPPYELRDMYERQAFPYLKALGGEAIISRYIRILGRGESAVDNDLRDLIGAQGEVTIAPYASVGEVMLRVTARAGDDAEALGKMQPTIDEIQRRLGEYIYSVSADIGMNIETACAQALLERKLTVAFAESLTAGLVCSRLGNVPGISAALNEAFVTYSNDSKSELLGVPGEMLREHGAVSEPVARAMAEGLLARGHCDIAVSLTGIAGPDGGSEAKPVGLCYIGIASKQGTAAKEYRFSGSRGQIRHYAANYALDALRRQALEWKEMKQSKTTP